MLLYPILIPSCQRREPPPGPGFSNQEGGLAINQDLRELTVWSSTVRGLGDAPALRGLCYCVGLTMKMPIPCKGEISSLI